MAKPIEVTDKTFEELVLKAELPTVVDFWAVWCHPCKLIAPVLEEIAEDYAGQIQIAKLDVDANNATAFHFGVMSIPTLILFKDGQAVERVVGNQSKDKLLAKFQPHLG